MKTTIPIPLVKNDLVEIIKAHDMTQSEVAREARISDESLHDIISGAIPNRTVQIKIESVLDRPIWSTPEQFEKHRKLRMLFGCDPLTLTINELRKRAHTLGAKGYSVGGVNKEKLISVVAEGLGMAAKRRKEICVIKPLANDVKSPVFPG